MNVLLIAQCDKRALTETRRILDQFAERRGDRTWQTSITQDGLDTLRKLLRKTARKNTAVACHWIRGRDHSELMWIVGDGKRFNAEGAVPTNTTRRNVLRREDENDWHSLTLIQLLTRLAALLHDLGKACAAFQERLKKPTLERNEYRHEWISLRLFQAFVGDAVDDATWLQRLIAPTVEDDARWFPDRLKLRDGLDDEARTQLPFSTLPALAKAVGWLVLTHHRLPVMPAWRDGKRCHLGAKVDDFRASQLDGLIDAIACDWNELPGDTGRARCEPYWHFPHGLPVTTPLWRKAAARTARGLLDAIQSPQTKYVEDPFVMHLARLALMVADHHYSRLRDPAVRLRGEIDYPLYANTDRKTGQRCQRLDEHLLGVERHAGAVIHALPGMERHLPRLVRHKGLGKRSGEERFRWQDRAVDLAAGLREAAANRGAFIVNMASTGCGKTLANARIMNALADPKLGMRCAFALGLRTLTQQTGQAFRELLSLSDDVLAIKVGGTASRELFEFHEREAERFGSASAQDLLDENAHVLFEGNDDHPLMQRLSDDPQVRSLIAAPVLVCTIDHLTPATESQRGGRQIAPMLRLLTSDLVLDEPDDFDTADLPALTRLVHWAGLLGSRVLLSSATLPPALVEGLFLAYRKGREAFQSNRGERPGEPTDVCCAWVDEFTQMHRRCVDAGSFRAGHDAFARERHARLGQQPVRRRAELLPLKIEARRVERIRGEFAAVARDAAVQLHARHFSIDPRSGQRVSFGLIRMANITPLIDMALALFALGAPPGIRMHLCVYHARFPLLIRSLIEARLDRALDRRHADAVFELPDIRCRIDADPSLDHVFVVLGSPVTEVGRDHDYDWAVVEPSSMRSLIQLAGRVRRHRPAAVDTPNVLLFERNLRSLERVGEPAFRWPGFESAEPAYRLRSHALNELLCEDEYRVIDARPRLLARTTLDATRSFVDLEHARMAAQMLPSSGVTRAPTPRELRYGMGQAHAALNATTHWAHPQAFLSGVLQQQQRFRDDNAQPEVDLVLLPNEDEDGYALHRIHMATRREEALHVCIEDSLHRRMSDSCVAGEGIGAWGVDDYWQALMEHAERIDRPLRFCAERYGTVSVPKSEQGWDFHPVLGFRERG